ncbi:MAG TPA: alpha/beta hydrolase-fold protein [Candidatus Acidoferrum sp.]|nr:alpha/beta hydrolase-fold protein [Candidatus Acidoferrum sp.]
MKISYLPLYCAVSTVLAADEPKPPVEINGTQSAAATRLPAPQYQIDPNSLSQEGVPKGKLEGPFIFKSQVFSNTVRKYWVYVPAQYSAEKPACVLVLQDGQRATRTNFVQRVPQVMENLIAKKEMPVTIGIFITPGSRGEEYTEARGGNPDNRSFEYDSLGDRYSRFLIDEMLPEVSKKYNLTKNPEGRAIGGFSSGAICAFNVAWEQPDQFRKVISCIGSFTDIRGGHVFPKLVRETEKKPIRIFLEDTLNDNRRPENPNRDWHLQNVAMLAALIEKGYDVKHSFAEGTHSDSHGGSIMPEMLRWLWRDYPK